MNRPPPPFYKTGLQQCPNCDDEEEGRGPFSFIFFFSESLSRVTLVCTSYFQKGRGGGRDQSEPGFSATTTLRYIYLPPPLFVWSILLPQETGKKASQRLLFSLHFLLLAALPTLLSFPPFLPILLAFCSFSFSLRG